MSSTKSRSSSVSVKVHLMLAFVRNVVSFMTQSIPRQKKKRDNLHPYLTPVFKILCRVLATNDLILDLKSP